MAINIINIYFSCEADELNTLFERLEGGADAATQGHPTLGYDTDCINLHDRPPDVDVLYECSGDSIEDGMMRLLAKSTSHAEIMGWMPLEDNPVHVSMLKALLALPTALVIEIEHEYHEAKTYLADLVRFRVKDVGDLLKG